VLFRSVVIVIISNLMTFTVKHDRRKTMDIVLWTKRKRLFTHIVPWVYRYLG